MKILFFGDIVGRIGREALKRVLPELRDTHEPDVVIANAENLAHGKGVTDTTFNEMLDMGVDFMTSGNHVWRQGQGIDILSRKDSKLLRPANYPSRSPGGGVYVFEVGTKTLCVVNLQGRVFMHELVDDPFQIIDQILKDHPLDQYAAILVDFHAEATSEKNAFGWYLDGRVSAVLGTHTHVPTADARVLPKGTAYITDIGMTGPRDSVIGVDKDIIIKNFLTSLPVAHEIPESGEAVVNAVILDIDEKTGQARDIKLHQHTVTV